MDPVRLIYKTRFESVVLLMWIDILELSFSNFVQPLALEHGALKIICIALFLIIPRSVLSKCTKIGQQGDASNSISNFGQPIIIKDILTLGLDELDAKPTLIFYLAIILLNHIFIVL